MTLIFGTYLAGSLLTTLVPIALLIAFAVFFYRQARRMPANASVDAPPHTGGDPAIAPAEPFTQS
jgi:hypothetical protein